MTSPYSQWLVYWQSYRGERASAEGDCQLDQDDDYAVLCEIGPQIQDQHEQVLL